MHPAPLRIEPTFSPRIWGSRSLAPLFPEKSGLTEPLGEAWLTGLDCTVERSEWAGKFGGKTLGKTWREMPAEWRGKQFAREGVFPLLVKFIFPTDKLSIQVHPDDAYASVHETAAGGRGKTEMWHIVSAESGAQVLLGLKDYVKKQDFLNGLAKHTLESLFLHHKVKAGDTIFVPAGAPHTIGPGMVICEVQQSSDLTYRVYDYGRVDSSGKERELHIAKALDVTKFGRLTGGIVAPLPLPHDNAKKALLAACPFFATERWEFCSPITSTVSSSHFSLLVILDGAGNIQWQNSVSAPYLPGYCWFIPASLGTFILEPERETKLIRTYVPDLTKLCAEIRQLNFSEARLSSVVFA